MRRKEFLDRRVGSISLPCQQIKTIEMNVSEVHCSAAMGRVGDTSCMSVCVYVC